MDQKKLPAIAKVLETLEITKIEQLQLVNNLPLDEVKLFLVSIFYWQKILQDIDLRFNEEQKQELMRLGQ